MLFKKKSPPSDPTAVTHSHPEAMLRRRAAPGWLWITALAQT